MKVQWFKAGISKEAIEEIVGVSITNLVIGLLDTGKMMEIDKDKFIPQKRNGIEIEFAQDVLSEKLNELDRKFVGFKREGGADLGQELDSLKARIEKLETK